MARLRPRRGVAAAVLLACLAAAPPGVAVPRSLQAAPPGTVEDPDDVAGPLDIRTATLADDGSVVRVGVTTYQAFADEAADFAWLMDLDGNRQIDALVVAFHDGAQLVATLLKLDAGEPVDITVTRTGGEAVEASFSRSDLGQPASLGFAALSFTDLNGNDEADAGELDEAPPDAFDDRVDRLAGSDRISTAVAISEDLFLDGDAGAVVLARADAFADALAGAPLAAAKSAPLLLTPTAAIDARTEAEIRRTLPVGQVVYLLGGTGALGQGIETRLRSIGYQVVRYAGNDRFETAVAIADLGLGNPPVLLLTTGLGFADALGAGAAAAEAGGAVLLTNGSTLPPPVVAYMAAHPTARRYAVGGPAAAADPTATAVAGANRYQTARLVAETFFRTPALVGVASGTNFPDALGGGAHIAALGGPLLLTPPDALPAEVQSYLIDNAGTLAYAALYGGTGALSEAVRAAVAAAIT